MRKFINEHEWELLLILIAILGISRWWIPSLWGFDNLYSASHWVFSYDHGFIRRGLVGSIVGLWMPIITLQGIYQISIVAYCTLLGLFLVVFCLLMKHKDKDRWLSRLILFFIVNPATIAFLAQRLGGFDLFLVIITFLCLIVLTVKRSVWLIPFLMLTAMLIHEAFLIMYAPTILAALIFVYFWDGREKRIAATLVISVIVLLGSYLALSRFGTPTLGYEEFSRALQSRANFFVTELSRKELYYSMKEHVELSFPYFLESGANVSFLMALLVLSPTLLLFFKLWTMVIRTCKEQRIACGIFVLATLSAFILYPIAFDHGRWISAFIFCSFFAFFFLIGKDIIKVDELAEYFQGSFSMLFVSIILTYVLFGPLGVVYAFPYKDNMIYTFLSVISILFVDIGFYVRGKSMRSNKISHQA